MESAEASAAATNEPAEGDVSTIVELLPQVPEPYAYEEQALDGPDLRTVDMELEEDAPIALHEGERNKSLLSEFDDYKAEVLQCLTPVEPNGHAAGPEPTPAPDSTNQSAQESARAFSPSSEMTLSELMQSEPTPTKRSLRKKTRKRVYQEEESEIELPSEEETLFPRVNTRYYSDDEYVPGSERKSKSKKSHDDYGEQDDEEEDEEIVVEFPKRRRKRKKAGEQKTPAKSEKKPPVKRNRGRAKIQSESGTSEAVVVETAPADSTEIHSDDASKNVASVSVEPVTLDSDSDIENCLSVSKIKIEDKAKVKLFTDDSKDSLSNAPDSKQKKSNGPTSEMGKAFENFLVTNSELKIKKLSKKAKESTTQLEIPTIEPPELIKLIDSWTQTEVPSVKTSGVQTTGPYAMRMSKNLPLSSEQSDNACEFMKNVLTMTTELGTLMCQKSKEFIEKKINADYIKDTTKVAFCKEKTSLLFKLAKDNLTKIEDLLEKNYEEYITSNNLEAAVEKDKILKANERDADSDCEIVEVKEEPKKKFNANTVFLNKELSIKIAKKPATLDVKTTPSGRQLKVPGRGGHAVWINKSIMVKKVKPNQSFLAQDGRFEKPPDNNNNKIEDIVQSFFENYSKINARCQPFLSTEWLIPTKDHKVVCNYFVLGAPPQCSKNLTGSGSEDDGFFDSPSSNETVPVLNDQYDVVGAPDINPLPNEQQQSSHEPEPLVTICLQYLHNLLYKPRIGESLEVATYNPNDTDNFKPTNPENIFRVCIENLEKSKAPKADSETIVQKNNPNSINQDGIQNELSSTMRCVKEKTSPEKLSIICLKSICKYSKISMTLNGLKKPQSHVNKSTLLQEPTLQQLSLKMMCYRRMIAMLYKKNPEGNILAPVCTMKHNAGGPYDMKSDNFTVKDCEINTFTVHVENHPNVCSSEKVKSLNCMCTEAINCMLNFTGHMPTVPAITDVRQLNEFHESEEDSIGDECDFPDEDYQEYDYAPQKNWFGKIQVSALDMLIRNFPDQPEEVEQDLAEGITLKLEPIDDEENQSEFSEPTIVKVKKENLNKDTMVAVHTDAIIPKTESASTIENDNDAENQLLNHLTEHFLDNQFEVIMRRNKIRPQGSPLAETPYDAIFSQSQHRVRREFEPDSDPENDSLDLLTVQSFRDFNVQPPSKAKGTLLESSSDDESKKNSEASVKRKRGRPRKNKNENKNKSGAVQTPAIVLDAPPPVPVPKNKDKVSNEIEILTRRMRERIRNEEKEKQKESSTDSESEILYSLKAKESPELVGSSSSSKLPSVPEKKSLKKKEHLFTPTRSLRSSKQDLGSVKSDVLGAVSNEPRVSPDFPGFGPTDESEAASYRSYLKYLHDKGIEDLCSDNPNLPTNSSVHDTVDTFVPKASTLNDTGDVDCVYEDGDYFTEEFDTSCVDELSVSKEPNKNCVSDSAKKKQVSKKRDKIIDEMDEEGFSMLTPQVAIVVDENKKVDLGFVENPVDLKEHKKISQEIEVTKKVVTNVPDVIEPVLNNEAGEIKDPGVPVKESQTAGIETVKIEPSVWTMRDGWKCYKITDHDEKLYQLCYVPMDKLPETFVQTYLEFVQVAQTRTLEKDPEIDRLTNLKSLHRASYTKEDSSKRLPRDGSKQSESHTSDASHEAREHDDHSDVELEPSDDEHVPPENADNLPSLGAQNLEMKTENTLAKNSLMGDGGSDSEASAGEDPDPADVKPDTQFMTGPKSKRTLVVNKVPAHPDSLILTADKMMKKDLELLHAPVVLGNVLPNKMHTKQAQKSHKGRKGSRDKSKSDADSDASSEEEKQWITTKEKLLRRLQKKHRDQMTIDDDKRARLVSTYIEKKADETTNSYSQTLLQQRQRRKPKMKTRKQKEKELRMLSMELQRELVKNGEMIDMNLPIHGRAGAGGTVHRGGRRNIRKVIDKKSLARSTVIANMEEFERKKRLGLMHLQLCKHLGCESTVKAIVIDKQLCLEYDFSANRPAVSVHEAFTNVMKAHQCEGLKFMWDASFETLKRIGEGHPGGGCILAHCMGLGKTLQVLALLHTVMTHRSVGVKRVLVCCPLSTVLNWVDEIHKWMGPVKEKFKVFELSKLKKTYERAYQLEDWYNGGGIFIIGYELFRSLTTLHPYLDDIRPTIINKINSALLDPGPDIVICDEGHLLKNDCSGLAVAMSRVKTSRRIVLTGTPMQNNLREYYCMVNFVKPNLLGTYSEFSNRFENPIMNGQHRDSSEADIRLMKARSHILHRVLEGCLQRQEASVLYPYLPKKCEYTVFISLSKCQSDLYKHYLDHLARQSRQSILKDFHILQKIWTHPQVLHNFNLKSRDDAAKDDVKMEDDLGKEELGSEEMLAAGAGGEVWWTQHLDGGRMLDALDASNKFQVVFRILDECVRVGDKLLIFSTSLLTMDSLEYFLKTIKQWQLGHDYYRLDGSVPPEVRQKWCREFNADNNVNTRLFLISTRAGCLGLNMTAANRVIILDTSWNPAHDIQSIFRVYRFGQKKDCYIYRLVSMGTMEQKIYERSVTKQAVACRVVDEQQIDRHYNMAELTALYSFEESDGSIPPLVTAGDALLLGVARALPAVRAVHEHDSLLRDSCEQQLPEHERAAAWDQFQREQAHTQDQPKEIKRKKKMQPPSNQQEMNPTLADAPRPCPLPPNVQVDIPMSTNPDVRIPIQNTELIAQVSSSPKKRKRKKLRDKPKDSGSSTDSASESAGPGDGAAQSDSEDEDKQSLASLLASRPPAIMPPIGVVLPPPVKLPPEPSQVIETKKLNMMNAAVVRVYSGDRPRNEPLRNEDSIVLSDTEQPSTSAPPKTKARRKQQFTPPPTMIPNVPKPPKALVEETVKEKVPLHPSLLTNPYFLKIVAHTYRSWNPNLEDEAAIAAAEFSAQMTLKKGGEILSGTLYDIAVKTLGVQTMKVLWHNYQSEKEMTVPMLPDEEPAPAPAPDARKVAPLRLKRMSTPAPEPAPTPAPKPTPTPAAKPAMLKLREPASLMRPQSPPPPPLPPKPVSLHIGAHPSAGLIQSNMVDLCDDNDGEEESILPDDDVPRIGTASPPPPPPPPPPRHSPPPLTPISAPAFAPARTARKKTTPNVLSMLEKPTPEPTSGYDVITVPHSAIVHNSKSQAHAATRVTFIRKLKPVPTHIIDSSNQIVPISMASNVEAPPPSVTPLAPQQQQRPLPLNAPICLDSDDDEVTPVAPPTLPAPRPPTQPASATPRPNILHHTLAQSNIMQLPIGQVTQRAVANHQPPGQNENQQRINLNQFIERLQPQTTTPTLNSLLQQGTQMGNIILVPASAFQGQAGLVNSAPIFGVMPQQFGTHTVPVSQNPPASVPPVPTPVSMSSVAPPPAAPPAAAPPADTSASFAQEKRRRGRPRKHHPTMGDRLVFTSSGQAWQKPAAQTSPAPAPVPAPAQRQVLNVDIPIRPEKPPSVPQEPTSTTGDEPTVDLTDEPRARDSSSSSGSRSSSSSSSSRDSSPDNPLSIFKNVVKIHANNYNEPPTSKSKQRAREPTITFTDLDDLELPSKKLGTPSSQARLSSSKPAQPQSKLQDEDDMITFTDLDDLELPSSKPGPSSKPRPSSSAPAHPSKHWPIAAESGPSTAKAGQSLRNKKPSLMAKTSSTNTASWQIPKFLSPGKKPSTKSKEVPAQKKSAPQVLVDSVDLTDTKTSEPPSKGTKHKMAGKERVLGTVDLTDEPVAKKPAAAQKKPSAEASASSRPSVSRSSGVTSTQGAKNITLTNTGAITFTPHKSTVQDSAKPKVNVTSVKSEPKVAVSEKRKARAAATPAKKSKQPKIEPMSLEDFSIDDILDDIIELE